MYGEESTDQLTVSTGTFYILILSSVPYNSLAEKHLCYGEGDENLSLKNSSVNCPSFSQINVRYFNFLCEGLVRVENY